MSAMTLMEIQAVGAATTAALETGLLAHLAERPGDAAGAAAALELDPTATALVLELLATAGVLDLSEGRYRVPDMLALELRGPQGDLRFASGFWNATRAFLEDGQTAWTGAPEDRNQRYAGAVSRLGLLFTRPAASFARQVAPKLPEGARVLDAGAGAGVWSLPILEERPDVRLTALDLPDVLPSFEAAARARGLEAHTGTLAGNYFEVELPPARFDLVIFANVLHLETSERARSLLLRFAPALREGGRIAVIDAFPDDSPDARRAHAAYAFHLGLRLQGASPHPEADVRTWLAAAGIPQVDHLSLGGSFRILAALLAR